MCLLTVVLAGAPARSSPSVEVGLDVLSKYVWRGFTLTDDWVAQPTVTLSNDNLAFNIWASYDLGDELTELDYTLSHSFEAGDLELEAGFIYYTFPNVEEGEDTSQELYVSMTRPGQLPLNFVAYYDYDAGDGLYLELGTKVPVSREREQGTVSAALGYNRHQWRESTGFSHALVSYTHDLPLGAATISPLLAFSAALDGDDFDNEFYGGVGVSAGW
jgi:hypothetical protein